MNIFEEVKNPTFFRSQQATLDSLWESYVTLAAKDNFQIPEEYYQCVSSLFDLLSYFAFNGIPDDGVVDKKIKDILSSWIEELLKKKWTIHTNGQSRSFVDVTELDNSYHRPDPEPRQTY